MDETEKHEREVLLQRVCKLYPKCDCRWETNPAGITLG